MFYVKVTEPSPRGPTTTTGITTGTISKNIKHIEKLGTDLGWFGNDFGMVWGYFRDGFGPILKTRKFDSLELKK